MPRRCRLSGVLALATALAVAPVAAAVQRSDAPGAAVILALEPDGFWVNLHHFLHVLGRAEDATPDAKLIAATGAPAEQAGGLAKLDAEERQGWREAIDLYAGRASPTFVVSDRLAATMTRGLAAVAETGSLESVALAEPVRLALERAAPAYRRVWWPRHRQSNAAWAARVQSLLDRHGRSIAAFVSRAYQVPWPAGGYAVHIVAYSNKARTYYASGDPLVIASRDPRTIGANALEVVFHEALHQWDEPMLAALQQHAGAAGRYIPQTLTHALIFYTTGEAVRRRVTSHVPYAESAGIWANSIGVLKPRLDRAWRPWLDGRGTRELALIQLLEAREPLDPAVVERNAAGRY